MLCLFLVSVYVNLCLHTGNVFFVCTLYMILMFLMLLLKWSEGKFGYSIHEANTSWRKTKWSTSVLQLDPNTWVLEYSLSSVMESSSLLSLTIDVLTHMTVQAAKNVNRELFWMFSAASSRKLYSEVVTEASTTMTPT